MDKRREKYNLKIFTGSHKGAEIPLGEGIYVIGTDDECDIILTDSNISPQHVTISISDGHMSLTPKDDAVYLDGMAVGEREVGFTAYQVLTIGMTHMSIGPATEAWPQLSIPDIRALEKPEEKAAETEGNVEAQVEAATERKQSPSRKVLLLSGCGLLVLFMIFLFVLMTGTDVPLPKTLSDKTLAVESVRSSIRNLGFPDLRVVSPENGPLSVQGYVETNEQKRQLFKALREYSFPIGVKVHSTEDLVEASREMLRTMGLQVDVQPAGPGIISLRGYVSEKGELDKTLSLLRQDIPAIGQVENRIVTGDELTQALTVMLEGSGLEKKIGFQTHRDYVLVTGSLNEEELKRWRQIKEAFFSKYGGLIETREELTLAERQRSNEGDKKRSPYDPALDIKGVSLGPVRYITLADGTRCFEGGKLKNGYVVKRIEPNRIILKRKDHEINLTTGE